MDAEPKPCQRCGRKRGTKPGRAYCVICEEFVRRNLIGAGYLQSPVKRPGLTHSRKQAELNRFEQKIRGKHDDQSKTS